MRLLLLSFYYQPDLCAGSFRTTPFAEALRRRLPADAHIDVITTAPNRYASYARAAPEVEIAPGWELRRIALPAHTSDMRGQSRAFVHFARGALRSVTGRRYDAVFATSSRLMTAALGAWIAQRKRARLYLDIRDIFADTIGDLLPVGIAGPARGAFSALEAWTVKRADRINLVSPGFADYFNARYGQRGFANFTNGIDEEFLLSAPPSAEPRTGDGPVTVLYAGNIGEGQGLHEILPELAVQLAGRARFVVIGDGGRRAALEAALKRAGATNVELRAPLERAELLEAYRAADVLFVHLGRQPAFAKVLPSKLFEFGALGKPVLAGVGGYAARFIREEIDNAAVFAPGDVAGAVRALGTLSLTDCPRPGFVAKYRRSRISAAMADDFLKVAKAAR